MGAGIGTGTGALDHLPGLLSVPVGRLFGVGNGNIYLTRYRV